jgi:putative phosphonate metabolism protein
VKQLYSAPMSNFPRYAIYYAPARDSDLDRFGAQLLGYDAFAGDDLPFPEGVTRATPDWHELTAAPRKYGFHATLKAPFALAPDKTETELFAACSTFAATPRTIPVIKPVVGSISGFIAVIPAEPPRELIRLAADCVTAFDTFRAPLTEADRARRNPSKLTPTQRDHLDRWGYPYVMDDFRFHMTLTGRLGSDRREGVLAMLQARFAGLGLATLAIDRIVVFRQESAAARFRIVGEWELCGAGAGGIATATVSTA